MFRSVIPLARLFRKNRLAFYRQVMGIPQIELARLTGVSPSAISKWEQDWAVPQRKYAYQVAEILRVPVQKLWPDEPF